MLIDKWKNLSGSIVKACWDATLDGFSNKMSAEIVIRDNKGEVIGTCCQSEDLVTFLVLGRLKALWRALKFCTEIGLHNFIFEGDARKIIEDIKDMKKKLVTVWPSDRKH